MSSSDRETVRTVARLARIAADDEQLDAFADDFRRILTLAEEIASVETDDVVPMAHPLDLKQRLRSDEVTAENQRERFLALAPDADGEHFLVPRVIE